MSERLAEMYPSRHSVESVVAAVIPAHRIRQAARSGDTWYNVFWDLRDQPAAIQQILEAAQQAHGQAPGMQEAMRLMEQYEGARDDLRDGVHVSDDYRLVPVGLEEHHHKARIFAGTFIDQMVAQAPISHALLEIGPTIAAQESDYQIAKAIESLGRLYESKLREIMNQANPIDANIALVAMEAQDLIDTIRGYAATSIEFRDLAGGEEDALANCEPIRVVLECKLRQEGTVIPQLGKFIECVHKFEACYVTYTDSRTGGEKLIAALQAACARASSICAPLYDNLERHLSVTRKAIANYLRHPDPQVSSLLSAIRHPSQSKPPAPALWLKTPVN